MTASTWIAWTALAASATAGIVLHGQGRELSRRLETLESAPAPAQRPAAGEAAGPTLSGEGALATRRELAAVEARLEALTRRADSLGSGADGAAPGGSDPAAAAAMERRVQEALARQMDGEDFRKRLTEAAEGAAKATLDKKPTFAALAQHLALEPGQETDFRRDLEDTQGALFALLADRRPDGRVLLEEIGAAESLPEGDPKRMQVFLDLFQLKIPGSEETYVARAVTLAVDFRKRTSAYLKPEQSQRFAALDVDLFGVKMN